MALGQGCPHPIDNRTVERSPRRAGGGGLPSRQPTLNERGPETSPVLPLLDRGRCARRAQTLECRGLRAPSVDRGGSASRQGDVISPENESSSSVAPQDAPAGLATDVRGRTEVCAHEADGQAGRDGRERPECDSDADRAAVGKPLHPDAAFGSVDAPPHPTRLAAANTNAIERLTGAASQPLG
jgi:hypothetical protein